MSITAPSITENDRQLQVGFSGSVDAAVKGGFEVAISFLEAEDGMRKYKVSGVQRWALTSVAGESHDVTVTIKGDTVVEANETFSVTLGDVTGTTARSEEGRVGEEWRTRGVPDH